MVCLNKFKDFSHSFFVECFENESKNNENKLENFVLFHKCTVSRAKKKTFIFGFSKRSLFLPIKDCQTEPS